MEPLDLLDKGNISSCRGHSHFLLLRSERPLLEASTNILTRNPVTPSFLWNLSIKVLNRRHRLIEGSRVIPLFRVPQLADQHIMAHRPERLSFSFGSYPLPLLCQSRRLES